MDICDCPPATKDDRIRDEANNKEDLDGSIAHDMPIARSHTHPLRTKRLFFLLMSDLSSISVVYACSCTTMSFRVTWG